ncbi:MAG: cyclic nucleotide-binding domain-containing protein [Lachnospiraceae bacterium]|nr:cyclic nucleotide-binding domain-containing protein [Lachnospiraceae bacterium]
MAELEQDILKKKNAMQTFCAGEIIMREGEACDAMYKIISGSVVIYMRYGEKDEHIIGIYSKSRCFGELNIFSEQPSIYTAVAYDDTLLMRITKDSVEEFVVNYPRNAVDMMRSMAQSFNVMQKNIELLLDDIYEKENIKNKRTEALRNKIIQYSIRGQCFDTLR